MTYTKVADIAWAVIMVGGIIGLAFFHWEPDKFGIGIIMLNSAVDCVRLILGD